MQVFFNAYPRPLMESGEIGLVRGADSVVSVGKALRGELGLQLGPNSPGCSGIGEEDRAERDVVRAHGEQLEHMAPGRDSAHPDDRERGGATARVDRRQRDWAESRAG